MSDQNPENRLDSQKYIDDIIEEMGMEDAQPDKLMRLKENLLYLLDNAVSTAASQTLNPEVFDKVLADYGDMKDPAFLFQQCVKESPEAQQAILSALEEFKEQTLNAYFQIKQ